MKIFRYIALSIPVVLMFSGCEDFLDVNTSKDSPTTITVDQALPTACFYAAQEIYDHAEYSVYLSQALTTASKSQTGVYAYSQGWEFLSMNRHPQWRRHFYDLGANINEMIRAAEKINSKNFILIGRTIMLQSTMLTTDVFGPMPRSNAYTSTSPTYDTQEEIYEWMFKEADDLIALYQDSTWTDNPNNIPITAKMDRIYSGDMKKWGLYAKALRARLWLRKLPNWENNPTVCNKIAAMVDDVLNDPDWEEPHYNYYGGTNEQNCPWGPSAPIINAWESRGNRLSTSIPTKFFAYAILGCYPDRRTNRLSALDPRAEKIMSPRGTGASSSDAIRWLESNIGMDVSMKVTFYPDLFATTSGSNPYTKNDGYIALITEEELMFIKAEAQYWGGDKAAAFNTTKAAVLRNFKRLNIKEPVAADGSNAKKRYDGFFNIRLPGESLFTIADLMQQKFIAMYLQPEQWNDMRRYNYSSKTNGILYDNVPVYTVKSCHNGSSETNIPGYSNSTGSVFGSGTNTMTAEYSLRRPYNLYEPYWMQSDAFGTNAELSPNAWINRLNYDPETEDKYNRKELERLGAFKNHEWLKKRMIWAYNTSGKATSSDPTGWK
ncbi:MAG: SusD/RagB family nutrient-binding outer membrane lipoprotein [Paludibacter sp.]|nr:SusD/RagB family nutrient-binding outer membrane lipoprotein [Paludibacter sp.]